MEREITTLSEDALRHGYRVEIILAVQGNIATTYDNLGRFEEATCLRRDVYFGFLKICGEEHATTLVVALNYTVSLVELKRSAEVKTLMLKSLPVAQRVLSENHELTFKMRMNHAEALYKNAGATLNDLREAVTTLEEATRTARCVMGGAHPLTEGIDIHLRDARAVLRARDPHVYYRILSINSHDARPLLVHHEPCPLARRRRLRPQST